MVHIQPEIKKSYSHITNQSQMPPSKRNDHLLFCNGHSRRGRVILRGSVCVCVCVCVCESPQWKWVRERERGRVGPYLCIQNNMRLNLGQITLFMGCLVVCAPVFATEGLCLWVCVWRERELSNRSKQLWLENYLSPLTLATFLLLCKTLIK